MSKKQLYARHLPGQEEGRKVKVRCIAPLTLDGTRFDIGHVFEDAVIRPRFIRAYPEAADRTECPWSQAIRRTIGTTIDLHLTMTFPRSPVDYRVSHIPITYYLHSRSICDAHRDQNLVCWEDVLEIIDEPSTE